MNTTTVSQVRVILDTPAPLRRGAGGKMRRPIVFAGEHRLPSSAAEGGTIATDGRHRQRVGMARRTKRGRGVPGCLLLGVGVVAAAVGVAILCSGLGGDRAAAPRQAGTDASPDPAPPAKPRGAADVDEVTVLNQGRDAVRRFLKDPATADFSTWDTTTEWFEAAGTWVTSGTVTYSTPFGRTERSYRVVIDYSEWPEEINLERVILGGDVIYQRPVRPE